MELFSREILQGIRDDAEKMVEHTVNNHWRRAYKQLADAADRLDAMEARTEDKEET